MEVGKEREDMLENVEKDVEWKEKRMPKRENETSGEVDWVGVHGGWEGFHAQLEGVDGWYPCPSRHLLQLYEN